MKLLFSPLDFRAVERAIAAAELLTSGDIRVVVHPGEVRNPIEAARIEFARLGMQRTRHRNAVLILVAPDSRAYAIFGDRGIHERCGESFWSQTGDAMARYFRAGDFTEGLIHGIREAGRILAQHFPADPNEPHPLPDTVVERGIVI